MKHGFVLSSLSGTIHSCTPDKYIWAYFKSKSQQKKESIIYVRVGYKNSSLGIIFCHHSASIVMPNGDPQDQMYSYRILPIPDKSQVCDVFWTGDCHRFLVCKRCGAWKRTFYNWNVLRLTLWRSFVKTSRRQYNAWKADYRCASPPWQRSSKTTVVVATVFHGLKWPPFF